jgi:predicted outer membrane repeat protein
MVQVFGGATGSATASFDGTVLENNSAQDGGGIFAAGTTTWRGGAIRGNTASARGGGAYVRQTLTFTVGVLQRNSAGQTGGGAFHETGSDATYRSVNVGADADVNTTDTLDGDLSTPQSFTGGVTPNCGGSGCAPPSP